MGALVHARREDRAIKRLHHLVAIGVGRRIVERQQRNAVFDHVLHKLAGRPRFCFRFRHLS